MDSERDDFDRADMGVYGTDGGLVEDSPGGCPQKWQVDGSNTRTNGRSK